MGRYNQFARAMYIELNPVSLSPQGKTIEDIYKLEKCIRQELIGTIIQNSY